MNKSSFEQNGGTYRIVGDYKIPNITLPTEASKPLGVWGMKRKDYLMQHNRVQFTIILGGLIFFQLFWACFELARFGFTEVFFHTRLYRGFISSPKGTKKNRRENFKIFSPSGAINGLKY